MWINKIDFPSPLEFSKLFLIVEVKIVTLYEVVLNICKGTISNNYITNAWG